MNKYFHRSFILILAVTILFTSVPFSASAEPPMPPETGYVMDVEKGLCLEIYDSAFLVALNDLNEFPDNKYQIDLDNLPKKLTPAKTPSKEKRIGSMILYNIRDWSYTKNQFVESQYTYELRPNELKINGKAYTITQKQYINLKNAAAISEKDTRDEDFASYSPLWTKWTMPSDVIKLEFRDKNKIYPEKEVGKYNKGSGLLSKFFFLEVKPETKVYVKDSKLGKFPNALESILTLKSGRKLSVIINDNALYVEMSDRDYGFEYKFRFSGDEVYTREHLKEMLNG